MAKYTISQFTMPDGNILELKDKVAREAIQGGSHFLGVTETEIADGSTTTSLTIGEDSVTVANGDIVVYGIKEFIYASADSKWHELGDVSMLGALAVKDSASGSYTPEGSVSATFSGATISYTPAGSATFSGSALSSSGSYTPAGTVSKPSVTVTESSISIKEFDNAGSVTSGSAAACTLPTLTFTPDNNENLTISWTAGSFTANTPTAVTLPTSKETSVLNGASAELAAAPTFSGTEATISVSGTPAGSVTFSGTAAELAVEGTIEATFSGTPATITVE